MNETRTFSFSAGASCLDFANTCGDRPRAAEDHLRRYDDLAAWGAAAGLVTDDEASASCREVPDGGAELRRAIALREAIYAVCSALAAGEVPARNDLAVINTVLRSALPNLELGIRGDGCCWEWAGASTVGDRILWAVARSAADLLTSDRVGRLRECAGEDCSWLFLDTSRNQRRKWCSMASCGNRAKARRHYARRRRAGA